MSKQALLDIRPDIPIIMCTGYTSTFDADKVKSTGIKACIMKPIDSQKLANTVRMLLDAS